MEGKGHSLLYDIVGFTQKKPPSKTVQVFLFFKKEVEEVILASFILEASSIGHWYL